MGFRKSIETCLSKYADFRGRASRSEYWYFVLFVIVVALIASVLDVLLSTFVVNALSSLALLLPNLSVVVRRLHDTGRSGYWVLAFYLTIGITLTLSVGISLYYPSPVIIPLLLVTCLIILIIIYFVFTLLPSMEGDNKYGPNPLRVSADADVQQSRGATGGSHQHLVRDVFAEIERLGKLRGDGVITEVEFEELKAEAIRGMT